MTFFELTHHHGASARVTTTDRIVCSVVAAFRRVVETVAVLAIALAGVGTGLALVAGPSGPGLFGNRALVVTSGSMSPQFSAGDLVLIRRVEPSTTGPIAPGTVITFETPGMPGHLVTHRVTQVHRDADGTVTYTTKGDANPTADATPVSHSSVVGTVSGSVPRIGRFVAAMHSWSTLALFVAAFAFAHAAWLLASPRPAATDEDTDL